MSTTWSWPADGPRARTARRTPTRSSSPSTTARRSSARPSAGSPRSSTGAGLRYEIVLVNDGSPDRSWAVISELARTTPARGGPQPVEELRPAPRQPGRVHGGAGRLRHHHGRRPAEPSRPGAAPHRRGPPGRPRRRLRQVRAQAGRRLPPARQQADQHDQPPGLRAAGRPRRVQLPHPEPRRRRAHLRLAHGASLRHGPGADVLQQPRTGDGPARAARRSGRATTTWSGS